MSKTASRTLLIECVIVVAVTLAALGYNLTAASIAAGYVDPVSKAGAQDEAVYGHAAIRMVRSGAWLTPMYLDRFLLNKPPLLHWMGAAWVSLLGVSSLSLRLAPLLAGTACCLIAYLWTRRARSVAAASGTVLLLLSNPTFHFMSRRFVTDVLLAAWSLAILLWVSRDPQLENRRTWVGVGVCTGLAVMTKSIAGLLPLLALGLYRLFAGRGRAPRLASLATVAGIAALTAAPWHLYQLIVHRYWFLSEYFGEQIVKTGTVIPLHSALFSQLSFYFGRLWASDPLLLILSAVGAVAAVLRLRRKDLPAREVTSTKLLLAWLLTGAAALVLFRYQSMYYILVVVPPLCLLSALHSPLFRGRLAWLVIAALTGSFFVKASEKSAPWRLDYSVESVPSAGALDQYCRRKRGRELIVVSPDDEFYSSILNLPFVRYLIFASSVDETKVPQFMRYLGIVLPTREAYEGYKADYPARLRNVGLSSSRPIGTLLISESVSELGPLVESRPEADFFLTYRELSQIEPERLSGHRVAMRRADRVFLLSRSASGAETHRVVVRILPKKDPASEDSFVDAGCPLIR